MVFAIAQAIGGVVGNQLPGRTGVVIVVSVERKLSFGKIAFFFIGATMPNHTFNAALFQPFADTGGFITRIQAYRFGIDIEGG